MADSIISNLAKQAEVKVEANYPPRAWLNSAHQLQKNAQLYQVDGNLESAYVNYLKYATIMLQLPKHPDFKSLEPHKVTEYNQLRRELEGVLNELETIKKSIVEKAKVSSPVRTTPSSQSSSSQQGPMMPKMMNTPDRITSTRLFNYFLRKPPTMLVLDCREYEDFVALHFSGASIVHIPPGLLHDKVTALEILNRLPSNPGYHRANFMERHLFELIVYYDDSSNSPELNPRLPYLVRALVGDPSGTPKRTPALIVGGFRAWSLTVRTASVRLSLLADGDYDGKGPKSPPSNPQPPPSRPPVDGIRRPVPERDRPIIRNTTEYLQNALRIAPLAGSAITEEQKKDAQELPNSILAQSEPEPASQLQKRNSQFDSPYFNFASPPSGNESADYSIPESSSNYYQGASSNTASASTFAGATRQHQPLQLLPTSGALATAPPLPARSAMPPPMPSAPPVNLQQPQPSYPMAPPRTHVNRRSIQRAPSPPSPGGGTSTLTYHYTEAAANLRGAWTAAGGSAGRGFVGLKNLGNTCYMNSILQCLIATRPLSLLFYDGSYRRLMNSLNPMASKGQLSNAFSSLLTLIFREENGVVISPSSFKESIAGISSTFRGSDQHDSQEFLAFLLDALHEDLNQGIKVRGGRGYLLKEMPDWIPPNPDKEDDLEEERLPENVTSAKAWYRYLARNDSPIVHWFQGQLKSQLKCLHCGQTSTTYNPFMYLSVPIPKGKNVRLNDCLNEFVREETLDDSDQWRCPRCKVPRRATKRITISRLPIILLVHLKRFSFQGPFRDKLNTLVDFQIQNLDLFPYVSDGLKQTLVSYYGNDAARTPKPNTPQRYDLYAISNHFGGMNGGHYTAAIRHGGRGAWFNFDDSRVSEIGAVSSVDKSKLCTSNAYSLFYVSHSVKG